MSTAIEERRRPRFGLQHRLALSREIAGMDQITIAEALGVARPTVSNYERGFTHPRRAVLVAWALATGVDVEWLENGEDPHPGKPDEGLDVPPTGIEPATYGTNIRRLDDYRTERAA